ncbi:ankyrin repeat-containing domain protein [Cokeromyces recurvatus]|uniref:ankyrin repeat-containing domain protein n=1 Tax=Cokeromyces recurvatus TaxID=90255 RepID=UPI00221F1477|nr:ankyrin repeat-containing domain protein [Cokeromyces recurvatus]KAI7907581.1 ankyrin repeat-containing domain protein [Cokeromyces recurvatus]
MQIPDEREHTLREVAALGNIKATLHLAHSGVNVNSQNAMNGWTALHWAAHRGHEHVVIALLRSGADPFIKTQKGQTALDLAVQHETTAKILRTAMGDQANVSVGPEPSLPFVPTYMKNPDLEKTWLMPDEFSENKVENLVRRQKAVELVENSNDTKQQGIKPEEDNREEKEILIYLSSRQDENLLGSVYLKNQTIENAIDDIKKVFKKNDCYI